MVFNSNMATKLEFQVAVEDRFAQKSIEVYRGFVQLYTVASQHGQQTLFRKPTDALQRTDSSAKVSPFCMRSISVIIIIIIAFISGSMAHSITHMQTHTKYKNNKT